MSYYDGFQLPSTHLGPGDINPAYSSVHGMVEDEEALEWAAMAALFLGGISTPAFVAFWAKRKYDSNSAAAAAFVASAILVGPAIGLAANLGAAVSGSYGVGLASGFVVPAAAAYYAFKD